MAKAVKTKEYVKVIVPKAVDFSKPGFSNVEPDSPQAKSYVRIEPLPSQINKR